MDAEAKCQAQGSYLCTLHARKAEAARGTGCSFDKRIVFSSTKCETSNGVPGFLAARGKDGTNERCYGATEPVSFKDNKVRCCTLAERAFAPDAAFLNKLAAANETKYDDADFTDYYDYLEEAKAETTTRQTLDGEIKAADPAAQDAGSSSDEDEDSGEDGDLSSGAIAAIVIVVLLVIIVAAVLGAIIGRRMLRSEQVQVTKQIPEVVVDNAVTSLEETSNQYGQVDENYVKQARLSTPSIRTHSYSSALDEPASVMTKGSTEPNGFVLAEDGSLRLHSVKRENPAFRQSVYGKKDVVGSAGVTTNTSL